MNDLQFERKHDYQFLQIELVGDRHVNITVTDDGRVSICDVKRNRGVCKQKNNGYILQAEVAAV